MKTFQKVIDNAGIYGAIQNLQKKPIFRSSAAFPVIHNENVSSRVLFMGYWILKREISEIGLVYTLRNQGGQIINRKYININTPRAQRIVLSDLLEDANHTGNFIGSIELEVFSAKDMVFPYPAFVLEYYNDSFSTCVHTTGRVYNDFEDFRDNDDIQVAESGFDVYGNAKLDSFFAFVNGPLPNTDPIHYEVVSQNGETLAGEIRLNPIEPYETVFVHLKKHIHGLDAFLGNNPGTIRIKHQFKGFFPRLLAGNFDNTNGTCSITHTFYDCSPLVTVDAYWKRASDNLYDSSIYAPVFIDNDRDTEVVFYPMFSPTVYTIGLIFFDEAGNIVKECSDYKIFDSSKVEIVRLSIKKIFEGDDIDLSSVKGVFIHKSWSNGQSIPNRIKFGLNIKVENTMQGLSSNICFNSRLGLPQVQKKTGTRKWAPLVNNGDSMVIIDNAATLKNYDQEAKVVYKIFREGDNEFIEREEIIPPYGQRRIEINKDTELKEFVGDKSAWIYVDADNPFVGAWYINFGKSGVVGADHSF
ncbi:MAG TPA: hypothetical protein VN721_15930 [Flavipsychrobacter sp.]|nr:hypothetical protein [Flavipsychrobacter sp.]